MYTAANIIQSIFLGVSFLVFAFLSFKLIKTDKHIFRIFGLALAFMALSELSAFMVVMLIQVPILDFGSLQYFAFTIAIIFMLATASSTLKRPIGKYASVFLALVGLFVAIAYLINPYLDGATIYSLRYLFSFQNPSTTNIFSLMVAFSFGSAVLSVASNIKDKKFRHLFELSFLFIITSLVISLLSYNDLLRIINSLVLFVALVVLAFLFKRSDLSKIIGDKK